MLLMRPPPPASQSLLELPLVRDAGALPLQHQLHDRLHQAILDGRLAAGSHLPGSRALATTLGVSRNTVAAVYEQLLAEGYVESDRQGTRVLTLSRPLSWQQNRPAGESAGSPEPRLAERIGGLYTAHVRLEAPAYLRPGIPDLAHFPIAAWQRSLDRALHANGPATPL
jgi:GntR family transcriptional regulator/MocR family aminotransferase